MEITATPPIADACNPVYAQRGLALFRVDAVRDG